MDCVLAESITQVSIHAPREGRDDVDGKDHQILRVSIHAPREGRDYRFPILNSCTGRFNPRAPRGARPSSSPLTPAMLCFNPRAPRGARRAVVSARTVARVSIHAPREGRDVQKRPGYRFTPVSIHAPREGRDFRYSVPPSGLRRFNPRAPRGARPLRAVTKTGGIDVSIHAPREGRDAICFNGMVVSEAFQSTRPARGATAHRRRIGEPHGVSIHAPREGRDLDCGRIC